MRNILYALVFIVLLAASFSLGRQISKEPEVRPAGSDTVTVRDTVRDTIPRPLLVRFDFWDTLYVPAERTDTLRDSILVPIPIEHREYRTEDYRAVVSGYRPSLDVMEVFRRTKTVTVREKPKRWGIGPQAGVGYPGGWYVGIGVSYHLWQW